MWAKRNESTTRQANEPRRSYILVDLTSNTFQLWVKRHFLFTLLRIRDKNKWDKSNPKLECKHYGLAVVHANTAHGGLCEPVRWAAQSCASSNDWSRFVDSHKSRNARWITWCVWRGIAIESKRSGEDANDAILMYDKSYQLLLLLCDWITICVLENNTFEIVGMLLVAWPFLTIARANYELPIADEIKISRQLEGWSKRCEPLWNAKLIAGLAGTRCVKSCLLYNATRYGNYWCRRSVLQPS